MLTKLGLALLLLWIVSQVGPYQVGSLGHLLLLLGLLLLLLGFAKARDSATRGGSTESRHTEQAPRVR